MAEKEKAVAKSDREVRWEAYLAGYKAKNPKKFAAKEARGEFKTVPVTFQ